MADRDVQDEEEVDLRAEETGEHGVLPSAESPQPDIAVQEPSPSDDV